jgi:hypothetical protein
MQGVLGNFDANEGPRAETPRKSAGRPKGAAVEDDFVRFGEEFSLSLGL